jgi:FkbM family methyltransferase
MIGKEQLRLSELAHPIQLRRHTTDVVSFWQIFCRGDYDLSLPEVPRTVIDGGANIGFFSVLMANRYPVAQILAIEPGAANFAALRRNVRPYPNIHPIRAGIWNRDAFLAVVDTGLGQWALRVKEVPAETPQAIRSVCIGRLMEEFAFSELDLLKLDVEGAEEAIFADNYDSWLPRTKVLIIELHDYISSTRPFWKAIRQFHFSQQRVGGNMCFTNSRLLATR